MECRIERDISPLTQSSITGSTQTWIKWWFSKKWGIPQIPSSFSPASHFRDGYENLRICDFSLLGTLQFVEHEPSTLQKPSQILPLEKDFWVLSKLPKPDIPRTSHGSLSYHRSSLTASHIEVGTKQNQTHKNSRVSYAKAAYKSYKWNADRRSRPIEIKKAEK